MFENAPSDVLLQDCRPLNPSLDYYMESEPVMSAHEDLASTNELSVRLGDLGVGKWKSFHTQNTSCSGHLLTLEH